MERIRVPEQDFNPRSREGSDLKTVYHTLQKIYFNPRSREGSDPTQSSISAGHLHFNPRSREGSDFASGLARKYISISIHAPAKGATIARMATEIMSIFQSTLPRRERHFYK